MVRSKYEIPLARPHVGGTNKLSITHDSVKNTGPLEKNKQTKKNDILRSTWIELRLGFVAPLSEGQ